ncbi:MAG: hypothetical protein K940chlam2_01576, partial [Chlamydiae bacterium]|nr:hypothetical protein [Chlamydiota bacterium]
AVFQLNLQILRQYLVNIAQDLSNSDQNSDKSEMKCSGAECGLQPTEAKKARRFHLRAFMRAAHISSSDWRLLFAFNVADDVANSFELFSVFL